MAMDGVAPSSGTAHDFNVYKKVVKKHEEDTQKQAEKTKKQYEKDVAQARKAHEDGVKEVAKEYDKTIENVKKEFGQRLKEQKINANEEVAKLKRQAYDKYGRYNGADADTIKQQYEAAKQSIPQEAEKTREQVRNIERATEKELENLNEKHNRELASIAETARDSSNKYIEEVIQKDRDALSEFLKNKKNEQFRQDKARLEQINQTNERAKKAIEDIKAESTNRLKLQEKAHQKEIDKKINEVNRRANDTIFNATRAHSEESAKLRETLKDVSVLQNQYAGGYAKGTEKAYREFNDEWKMKQGLMQGTYEDQIKNQKRIQRETENYLTTMAENRLKERDQKFSEMITKVNQDNRKRIADLQIANEKERVQMVQRAEKDKVLAEKALSVQIAKADEQKVKSLRAQAEAFQSTLKQQQISKDSEIRQLQQRLNENLSATDSTQITPAQEEVVRKGLEGQYNGKLMAEQQRNMRGLASVTDAYQNRMSQVKGQSDEQLRKVRVEHAAQTNALRKAFVEHIAETENAKEEIQRAKNQENMEESQKLQVHFSRELDRQRRQYEELLQTTRLGAEAKIREMKQEKAFGDRMAQRVFADDKSKMIREYETRLQHQKEDFDQATGQLKDKWEKEKRLLERNAKTELGETSKMYEQRISELKYQAQERERYIIENFERQLENIRRANAKLVQQTKS